MEPMPAPNEAGAAHGDVGQPRDHGLTLAMLDAGESVDREAR